MKGIGQRSEYFDSQLLEVRMKSLLRVLALFGAILSFVAVADTGQQFTVTGKLIPKGILVSEFDDQEDYVPKKMDWSKARIVVAHEGVNPAGETELRELASGRFKNGSIILSGQTEQPIDAQISVYAGKKRLSTLETQIVQGSTISFVLMQNHAHLELLGASRKSTVSESKFTILGDFPSMADELEGAIVKVFSSEHTASGESISLDYGRVVPNEGKFVIEADVDEPRRAQILIVPLKGAIGQTPLIIEPGAEISVSTHSESLNGMTASAHEGKHAQLVDSWQQSEEYVSTDRAYLLAFQEYSVKGEAEGNASNSDSPDAEVEETPRFLELARELGRIQYGFLNDVAMNAEDPFDALLAMELGAYGGQQEGLLVYDRLIKSLDKDLVLRRVIQDRNEHAMYIARAVKDRSLGVGQTAPDFALQNFEGEEITLSDILDGREHVLIDFWASWCAPCFATFPALKEMYASYREHGFEIVSISIDRSRDEWSDSTDEHELPWINLGELKGFEGDVVMSYGVNFVPKAYLLNSEGQIVQKDLSTDRLAAFLANGYGDQDE